VKAWFPRCKRAILKSTMLIGLDKVSVLLSARGRERHLDSSAIYSRSLLYRMDQIQFHHFALVESFSNPTPKQAIPIWT
jgi:hypothetical protein